VKPVTVLLHVPVEHESVLFAVAVPVTEGGALFAAAFVTVSRVVVELGRCAVSPP
jgi:hypothetical protein